MVIGPDGSEIDWHSGYRPPPDSMLAKLENSVKGIDTFKSLSERYAKNPRDAEAVFKLALKYYDHFQQDKALEKFKEGVALDPNGKSGVFITEFEKAKVTYTEYAEYRIALSSSRIGRKRDPQPFKSFINKYPESELLKNAYQQLSFAMSRAPKEEATKFFEEYTKKFSNDPAVLSNWLAHIVKTKENLDKGVELAEKIRSQVSTDLKGNNVACKAWLEEWTGKDDPKFMRSSIDKLSDKQANFIWGAIKPGGRQREEYETMIMKITDDYGIENRDV